MKWIELRVEVHPEAVDAVSNVFMEHGTGGVAIEQPVRTDREGELPPRPDGMPVLKAYLPMTEDIQTRVETIERALWHLQAFDLSPVSELTCTEIDEEDWANAWKEHFQPLKIGCVVVKPSWRQWDAAPDEIVVELDPGMAFGTGLHPTTAMMLEELQSRVQQSVRVLDLGTGSGILAIAAAKLGATVRALDSSEVAVEVARENVAKNGLKGQIETGLGSIERVQGQQFDVVLANIIASVLIDLATPLAAALKQEGTLLASGIIEERADMVRNAFREAGLEMLGETCSGDWWLFAARLPA